MMNSIPFDPLTMLKPVILPVSPNDRRLSGAERARALSCRARQALAVCSEQSGLKTGCLFKNVQGVPIPDNGVYWSVTHKPEYVGGILGLSPVGIDVEKIRSIHHGLFRRVADDAQWALDDSAPLLRFFRFWTAKEAVLKACGTGLKDLAECRIEHVDGPDRIVVCYQKKRWNVFQTFFDGHVAAATGRSMQILWIFSDHGSDGACNGT